jgi:hypothetical protein
MNAMRFAVKHAVATAVVVGGIVAFTAASYFALLAWAVLVGDPLGGPLAFPFMVLFALFASVVSVGLILLPATALAEWVAVKKQLRMAFQIPIATALAGVQLLFAALVISVLGGMPWSSAAAAAGVIFALLLVPLGVYWWSMQSADWLLRAATRWWRPGKASAAAQNPSLGAG